MSSRRSECRCGGRRGLRRPIQEREKMSEVKQIAVGDVFPAVGVSVWGEEGPKAANTGELFKGKKVALFAIPGAFTPTCTKSHCPAFVQNAKAILAKGVDLVAMTAVNDAFVLKAFSDFLKAEGSITMIADGNGNLAKATGTAVDLSGFGLGLRNKRYALILDDLKVTWIGVDDKGYENSTPEKLIAAL
eukprot:TRINITY_DN782_c0_g1_i1.p1 TRINITY_DN782_c0_g1~~TRINITY_DN782_c0_g1_i1.p1  ORF type:complete len:189 (-),score=15.06 TRINITY_DN782_c0_g1_i1:55-621(-)